jgi:uncharacterized membrane protein YozB (DUF420 family)
MSSAAIDYTGLSRPTDRSFFLLVLAAMWGGVLAGFVPDSLEHLAGKHVAFAPIVHLHAVIFVGWMVLLTVQFTFIRMGRVDLHRRLGLLGAFLIPVMLVLGPVTSYVMTRREFGTPDSDPGFIVLPWLGALCFALVSSTGLAYRKNAAVHKRLMLIATAVLADAGFGRWLGPQLGPLLGHTFRSGFVAFFVPGFIGSILIMAAMLGYDLITRRRPYPQVLAAMGFVLFIQVTTTLIYTNPAWTPIATHLLGH